MDFIKTYFAAEKNESLIFILFGILLASAKTHHLTSVRLYKLFQIINSTLAFLIAMDNCKRYKNTICCDREICIFCPYTNVLNGVNMSAR